MARGNEITVSGTPEDVGIVDTLIGEMLAVLRTGQALTAESVERSITLLRSGTRPTEVLTANILSNRGRTIRAKTLNQKRYVDAIDNNTIVFGIGPAGTGKTYLAVAKAVQALQAKRINRIVLTRPAVEAGERLGFLPGTLSEKIDPYLRPLYDALHDMIDPDSIPRLITSGTIEIAPLAYMRGRTLNDSFIILDEAQNTSAEQMKMFLTRLGLRLDHGRHRRRHPGRPARRHHERAARGHRHPRGHRRRRVLPAHVARRRASQAGRTHRRRLREVRREARHVSARHVTVAQRVRDAVRHRRTCGRSPATCLGELRLHPDCELGITLVDVERMTTLHEDWMQEPGPTDVLSFPIDEVRSAAEGEQPEPGILGDIVLCPAFAVAQAAGRGPHAR